MVTLVRISLRLIEDALRWVARLFRSTESVQAENLLLRRQAATGRCCDSGRLGGSGETVRLAQRTCCRAACNDDPLAGWRLFWRLKCRPGRPPIPTELRALIRRMARENVLWGEERIANELQLKFGILAANRAQVLAETVSRAAARGPDR
jgi:putative transposase